MWSSRREAEGRRCTRGSRLEGVAGDKAPPWWWAGDSYHPPEGTRRRSGQVWEEPPPSSDCWTAGGWRTGWGSTPGEGSTDEDRVRTASGSPGGSDPWGSSREGSRWARSSRPPGGSATVARGPGTAPASGSSCSHSCREGSGGS